MDEESCLIDFKRVFGNLDGLKVLEIGCGSDAPNLDRSGRDPSYESYWRPDLSRALHKEGAEVTGIDLLPVDDRSYNHIIADLTRVRLPDIVGRDVRFDVVVATSFFDSWQLKQSDWISWEVFAKKYGSLDPDIEIDAPYDMYSEPFIETFVKDLPCVIRDNGSFLVGPVDHLYSDRDPRQFLDQSFLRDINGDVSFSFSDNKCWKYDKILSK